jgi:hypothetical protein
MTSILDTGDTHRPGLAIDQWNPSATVIHVVANPPADLMLEPVLHEADNQRSRPLGEWLTTFHLAAVVLDPFTNESSWVLESAARILRAFSGSAARACLVVTASAQEAQEFLGPMTREFLVFADPDRSFVRALGLESLPAFAFIRSDGTVPAAAQGWSPIEWRAVAKTIASTSAWTAPSIPAPGDPAPFAGTPALG